MNDDADAPRLGAPGVPVAVTTAAAVVDVAPAGVATVPAVAEATCADRAATTAAAAAARADMLTGTGIADAISAAVEPALVRFAGLVTADEVVEAAF